MTNSDGIIVKFINIPLFTGDSMDPTLKTAAIYNIFCIVLIMYLYAVTNLTTHLK